MPVIPAEAEPGRGTFSSADIVDVFVYVVVLNLAAEFIPNVIAESFTISLLTAVMLKVTLEVVLLVKNNVKGRFKAATTTGGRIAAGLTLWLVLAGSKFVVLALEDLFFGDSVSLGGFISVTGLIVILLASREGVRRVLPGEPSPISASNRS